MSVIGQPGPPLGPGAATTDSLRSDTIRIVMNLPDHQLRDAYDAMHKLCPSPFRRILNDLDTLEAQVADPVAAKRTDKTGSQRRGIEVNGRLQRVAEDLNSDSTEARDLTDAQKVVLREQLERIVKTLLVGLFDVLDKSAAKK